MKADVVKIWLDAAIALHEKHMDGSEEPTMESQELMMLYMQKAGEELTS